MSIMLRYLFLALISLVLSVASLAQQQKMELLVIIDDTEPLTVRYFDRYIDRMSLFSIALTLILEPHNNQHTKVLQQSVGEYSDREFYIKNMIQTAFIESDKITLSFLNVEGASTIFTGENPNYDQLRKDGWLFVMHIKEIAGLTTPSDSLGKLKVSATTTVKVFDTTKKKRIFKQTYVSTSGHALDLDTAIRDKEYFTANYPKVHTEGFQIYVNLLTNNVMNRMAKHYGLEAEFPPVSKILKQYSNNFRLKVFIPKSWRKMETPNKYVKRAVPKKNEPIVIITDVDLLIKPLGQNDLSIMEYVNLRTQRLGNMGYIARPIQEYLPLLELNSEWVSHIFDNPDGNGKSIFLFQKFGNEYTLNHQIKLQSDNYAELLQQHKSEIEAYVNGCEFTVK